MEYSMRPYQRSYRFLLAFLALILCASGLWAQTYTKELADGITLTQQIISTPADSSSKPQIINALRIDPKRPGVRIQGVLSRDVVYTGTKGRGCEVVSSMAERLNATAVVNADFFGLGGDIPGDPLGMMVINEEFISEPSQRVVFATMTDGRFLIDNLTLDARVKVADDKWFPIRGINRFRGDNEMVLYTTRFCEHTCTTGAGSEAVVKLDASPLKVGLATGTVTEVKSGVGDAQTSEGTVIISGRGTGAKFIDDNLKVGDKITLDLSVTGKLTGKWEKIAQAVGGGSWLVRDGKEYVDAKDEGFNTSFSLGRNPRTAVGIAKDGKLIIVTVDGRQSISGGMSLPDLAKVMIKLGCVTAANLDGGGSTTMANWAGVINSPSGGTQRAVSNGIAVFGDETVLNQEASFSMLPLDKPVPSGTTAQIMLIDAATGKPLDKKLAAKVVWAMHSGAGFVDQSGRFYGFKARTGTVIASIGGNTATMNVETAPGQPSELIATLKADPNGASNRSMLAVSAGDLNGNPLRGAQVSVKVTGGTADAESVTLDAKGDGSTGITWDGQAKGQVDVACGGLAKTAKP
jgi:exopolysaccharide biosynthesis protein